MTCRCNDKKGNTSHEPMQGNLYTCSPQVKEIAYKSLIRCQLDYASPAWNHHTTRNISKIESMQCSAAVFVLGNYTYGPNAHLTADISITLKWPTLQHRRALYDLALFYKIRNHLINIATLHVVSQSPHNLNRYLHIQTPPSKAFR